MNKKWQLPVCICLLILNLLFIWGNSALPADDSGSISTWLQHLLVFLPEGELGHTIIRKMAHFAEFASLGCLCAWLQLLLSGRIRAGVLGAGLAVACLDETIQLFVPGRASALMDVWLDTSGFTAGLLLVLLGYTYFKHKFPQEEQ